MGRDTVLHQRERNTNVFQSTRPRGARRIGDPGKGRRPERFGVRRCQLTNAQQMLPQWLPVNFGLLLSGVRVAERAFCTTAFDHAGTLSE